MCSGVCRVGIMLIVNNTPITQPGSESSGLVDLRLILSTRLMSQPPLRTRQLSTRQGVVAVSVVYLCRIMGVLMGKDKLY